MAQLKEISRDSKEVYNATLCSKIPKKYLNDFFEELLRQRGKKHAAYFLLNNDEGILSEAFDWRSSVKGGDFWSNLENKMLSKAGIIVETVDSLDIEDNSLDIEDECIEKLNNIRDQRSEELAAIHADMRRLLELLKSLK